MIVIAGDSWSVGEWDEQKGLITHPGLAGYLADDGYTVHNIGQSGNSNLEAIIKLDTCLSTVNACGQTVSKVFVFQTEWTRDFSHNGINYFELYNQESQLFASLGYHLTPQDNFFKIFNVVTPTDLIIRVIQNFYQLLSNLHKKYGVEFYVIGGCADAIDYELDGVTVVCQSMTNLILTGQDTTDQPVYAYYQNVPSQNWLKKQFPGHLNELIQLYSGGENKARIMETNPKLFWPDGRHPNKEGHQLLYKFLKGQRRVV